MKINYAALVYGTQNCMNDIYNYHKIANDSGKWFSMSVAERTELSAGLRRGRQEIRELAEVLNIDEDNLYLLARAVMRYEVKTGNAFFNRMSDQVCAERLERYLAKEVRSW